MAQQARIHAGLGGRGGGARGHGATQATALLAGRARSPGWGALLGALHGHGPGIRGPGITRIRGMPSHPSGGAASLLQIDIIDGTAVLVFVVSGCWHIQAG